MGAGRGTGSDGGGDAPSATITSPSQQLQRKQQQQQQLTSQPAPAQSKPQSQNQSQNGGNGNANTQPPTAKELHAHLLLPHTKPPSATIPPQVNHESISTHTKIQHTPPPPNAPITPAHSPPNSHDQPLTSRFIDFSNSQGGASISPSSGGGARRSGNAGGGDGAPPSTAASLPTPNRHKSSSVPKTPTDPPSTTSTTASKTTPAAIAVKPSRTQQKLWLQRQSSQHEPPVAIPHHAYLSQVSYQNPQTHSQSHHHTYHPTTTSHSPSAALSIPLSRGIHPARLTKEFERVNREYLNTRRFMNPILDSLERTATGRNPDRRIPRRGHASDAGGNTMGLSQSLKETGR
ncbi:unnamed protein product [Tuber aestivum]|uniref:Uncharacterized protein n=1 Tax=Tuber aestivum TaxID=59557 RepID=A0A292Q2Z0_9PEZI|nr:unnamed protein product [Tuber aestivum]